MSDLIGRQIRGGENLHTEFKLSLRPQDSIARTVCAFLNSGGGTIFCGINDSGQVEGIENAVSEKTRIERYLQGAITPVALFTLSVELFGGRPIIVIEVPEGKDRPYVVAGAVYVRQGSVTRAADSRTLRDLVQDKAAVSDRWERRPSPSLDLVDLDRGELNATIEDAQASGRFTFDKPDDPLAVLRQLSMTTMTGFTQAADVVFGQHPSRRHPQCRIRLVRYTSDKGGDRYEDDRWFEGPLVRAFEEAFSAIAGQVRIQSRFATGGLRREDQPEYSLEALREGLVNAIAHRDYSSFSGGLTVSLYPGRLEIWNSGRLPKELQPIDLKRVHPSIPTNPDICHILYLRRLMERVGRGTQKIIAASKELGAVAPRWVDRPSGVTLTLFAADHRHSGALELNIRQRALLRALRPGDRVHPNDYAQSVADQVSLRQARRDLALLEEAGWLTRRGAARATYYERTDRD